MVKNKVLLILFQEVNLDGNWKKKIKFKYENVKSAKNY